MVRTVRLVTFVSIVLVPAALAVLLATHPVAGSSRRSLAGVRLQQGPGLAERACIDGLDNDGDGLVDCDDPDCARSLLCRSLGLDETTLENDLAAFRFVRTPFDLVLDAVTDRVTGQEYPAKVEPLWEITLRASDGTRTSLLPGDFPDSFYFEQRRGIGETRLDLYWVGIRIDPQSVLNVTASFRLPDGSPFVRATIRTGGFLQDASVFGVRFPGLNFQKIDGSPDNRVLYPSRKGGGAIISQPEAVIPAIALPYPTNHQLALCAYYNDVSRRGIYISCEDPQGTQKRFLYEGQGDSMWFSMDHVPVDNLTTSTYVQPYEYLFGPFQGGWWDAAKQYRQFALTQAWVPERFETRADIPDPLRNVTVDLVVRFDTPTVTSDFADIIRAYRDRFGLTSMIALLRGWDTMGDATGRYVPDYFPAKAGTAQAIADAHALAGIQVYVMPGTGSISYNPNTPSYDEENAGLWAYRDENLVPIMRGISVRMDSCTDYWRNKQKAILIDNLREQFGADGAWFDSFVVNDECYDPAHGHTVGGGTYIDSCIRDMLYFLRAEGRRTAPDYFLAEEPPVENFMDVLLFREGHYCPTRLGGTNEHAVPLFQAVYHEYAPTLATSKAKRDEIEQGIFTPIQLDMMQAHGFIRGARISVAETVVSESEGAAGYLINRPELQAHYLYLERMVDAIRYAAKYLMFGRLLRPLEGQVDVVATGLEPECEALTSIAVVDTSVWRARGGDIGLVFTNWSDAAQTIDYDFVLGRYGLAPGTTYFLYRLDASGRTLLDVVQSDFSRSETLAAKTVLVLELSTD